ncbi:MAG: family 78 glycoside hydrolase catalytic domain [Lentisphaerae bacterium]|nr:family 78 glycoside hydrolase catalytic domain [Lentisphaerota bacterium]
MKIRKLRTNHFTNPVGFSIEPLTLSWVVDSEKATKQKTARIEIATDSKFADIVFDSGNESKISSVAYYPDFTPEKRTRYFWRVTVVANTGESATAKAFFETGKKKERWQAKWQTSPFNSDNKHFFIKKTFSLADFSDARAYCSALGIYELEVNGKRATDEVLLPGYHSYTQQIQVQTFDITKLLKKGENTIGMHVGPGWYNSDLGWADADNFGANTAAICEVRVKTGKTVKLVAATDNSWVCAKSPVVKSSIYYGEDYDANLEIEDWSTNECKAGDWVEAVLFTPPKGTAGPLHDRYSPPITIHETLKPEIIKTPAGETVLDFKQNFTGWFEIKNRAAAGKTWSIQVGELLQQGNFFRDNLRKAEAQYTYTSDGNEAVGRPPFTFYGFRFMRLNNYTNDVNPEDFRGYVVHSKLDRTGYIKTSNAKVNKLFRNALWGQKGNFLDVPTDCPQRDERLGWTGDAQVFSGTAYFNMDCSAFYQKYMNDLILEQKVYDGGVPHTVPALMDWLRNKQGYGACAWGDVATVLPWTSYVFSGDVELLRKQYIAMKEWVRYIKTQDDKHGSKRLWQSGYHFADWLALDNYKHPESSEGGTDQHYVASVYYARSVELTLNAARVLDEKSDVEYYSKLLAEVKEAFVNEYFSPNGRCVVNTQTANVLALHMNLVPEKFRDRLIMDLVKKIKDNGMALSTGFLGTPILCRVLSDNGYPEVAYALLLREKLPGWLYEVNMGATTIWERWNSVLEAGSVSDIGMNSMNHYAYGSIVEWMYRHLSGLNPLEDSPGFRKVEIRPDPPQDFKYIDMKYDSPAGMYAVSWKLAKNRVEFNFTIPFSAQAKIFLPNAPATVKVGGKSVNTARGFTLTAGNYKVAYT